MWMASLPRHSNSQNPLWVASLIEIFCYLEVNTHLKSLIFWIIRNNISNRTSPCLLLWFGQIPPPIIQTALTFEGGFKLLFPNWIWCQYLSFVFPPSSLTEHLTQKAPWTIFWFVDCFEQVYLVYVYARGVQFVTGSLSEQKMICW